MPGRAQTVTNAVLYYNEAGTGTTAITSGPYTVTTETLVIDMSTRGDRSVTLPPASSITAGTQIIVKDGLGTANANNVRIRAVGTDTIDGSSGVSIGAAYGVTILAAIPTGWRVLEPLPVITEEQRFLLRDGQTALDEAFEEQDLAELR